MTSQVEVASPSSNEEPVLDEDFIIKDEPKAQEFAYDPKNLSGLFKTSGIAYKIDKPWTDSIKTIVLKEFDRDKLDTELPRELAPGSVLDLAARTGLHSGCRIQMKDGRFVDALCREEENVITPWAVASRDDIFFVSGQGTVDRLSGHLNAARKEGLTLSYDPGSMSKVTAPFVPSDAAAGTSGVGFSPAITEIFSVEAVHRDLENSVPDRNAAAELIDLGGKAGLQDSGFILVTQTRTEDFGFRDGVNWKSGAVSKNYLTPSQGMGFLALANVVHQGIVWKAFAEDAAVRKGLTVLKDASLDTRRISSDATNCICGIQAGSPAGKPLA